MIFAAVGTRLEPFDRLLRWLDELCEAGAITLPILCQSGHCRYTPRRFEARPFFPSAEMEAHIEEAQAVVCHAGAGLIGMSLQARKRPVVVPRRAALGENVNDHQLELCRALLPQGRIYVAEDRDALAAAIDQAQAQRAPGRESAPPPLPGGDRMKRAIGDLLRQIAASRGRRTPP